HETPGPEVQPGFLRVLCAESDAAALGSARLAGAVGPTSGRRLALARWLTDPDGPAGALVLRVRVNRVWQQLFGRGLVETAANFGVSGARPTHPERLEWRAAESRDGGQRLKPLLRTLMASSAHRQQSRGKPSGVDPAAADPANRLLWRMPLRRLEAEAPRDAMLAVSGKPGRGVGGAPGPGASKAGAPLVCQGQGLPPTTTRVRA